MGLPLQLWESLHSQLLKGSRAAGDVFEFAVEDDDDDAVADDAVADDDEQQPQQQQQQQQQRLRLVTSVAVKAFANVFVVDHMWTFFNISEAQQSLYSLTPQTLHRFAQLFTQTQSQSQTQSQMMVEGNEATDEQIQMRLKQKQIVVNEIMQNLKYFVGTYNIPISATTATTTTAATTTTTTTTATTTRTTSQQEQMSLIEFRIQSHLQQQFLQWALQRQTHLQISFPLFYINDEVGSRVRFLNNNNGNNKNDNDSTAAFASDSDSGSDCGGGEANFALFPFFCLDDRRGYSLLWPIRNCKANEVVSAVNDTQHAYQQLLHTHDPHTTTTVDQQQQQQLAMLAMLANEELLEHAAHIQLQKMIAASQSFATAADVAADDTDAADETDAIVDVADVDAIVDADADVDVVDADADVVDADAAVADMRNATTATATATDEEESIEY